jgi:hypothetical protein
LNDDDVIGSITFRGDDGTDYNSTAALIKAEVDADTGSNDMPGRLVFATTADGAASPTERSRIDSSGRFYVGGTVNVAHPNMDDIIVGDASGNRGITVASATDGFGTLAFGDSTDGSGTDRYSGFIEYYHDDDSMRLGTASAERVRVTSGGNVSIQNDSGKFTAGAGDDLQLYHNGTDSYVDTDVGDLRLRTTGSGDDIYLTAVDDVFIQVQGGETAAKFVGNGAVELNYDDTKKFETSAGGVTISGNMLPEANNTRDLGASGTAFANVYATTFTGALTGNSSTATEATNFTVTANNSTNETVYPVFVDGATGTQGAETDTGLTYNPSTGLLTATAFSGSAANLTALPITVTHTSYTGTAQITYSSNTITISATSNAYGTRTVSTSSPSGGANGDIWYQYS